ncbi:hypothetical protein [Photobacterium leiognathi]|uniref:hypothetical protein n=1 Tax=Photobacterium leiognathi TaxID=553611 RepID=UPI0029827F26|nr:hypothetical protein [Photobacterium leiognathi]
MQQVIDVAVRQLIEIIDSKENSKDVAWQFILEELDAAQHGNDFVVDRIQRFYINKSEYVGALENSWEDVDGPLGPQQYLLGVTAFIAEKTDSDIAAMVRITIVEYVLKHYQFGRYYLSSDYKIAKKPLALFDIVAKREVLNPNFKHILADEYAPVREVINRWASGFEDRDNKFNHQFQETFNSSFWELYLFQCFKDLRMEVDFTQASPDFTLNTAHGNLINVEAVTANHAQNSTPEWDNNGKNLLEDKEFLNFSCVRLLNAIESKSKKYYKTYEKYDHVRNNPYVIAVAPYEQPMFFTQNNETILRVLYAQGVDKSDGFSDVEVVEAIKNNKIPLELGLFTTDKFKHISAVIFSTTATIGKAITQSGLKRDIRSSWYHPFKGLVMEVKDNEFHFETHLDGLQIHHNPFADKPLPLDEFKNYEISHYFYDPKTKLIDNQQKPYTLISRNVFG